MNRVPRWKVLLYYVVPTFVATIAAMLWVSSMHTFMGALIGCVLILVALGIWTGAL
jgi:hypothetical protein